MKIEKSQKNWFS